MQREKMLQNTHAYIFTRLKGNPNIQVYILFLSQSLEKEEEFAGIELSEVQQYQLVNPHSTRQAPWPLVW